MAFDPALLEGGYVTDLLLTVTFDADVWEEGHLGTSRRFVIAVPIMDHSDIYLWRYLFMR